MGCSTSKLSDEQPIRLCKDRKQFIEEAEQWRKQFAIAQSAYLQSLKRVSEAIRCYVEQDEPWDWEFLLDSFKNPTCGADKKLTAEDDYSIYLCYPENRSSSMGPPSPRTLQWDEYANPFPSSDNPRHRSTDDETREVRQVQDKKKNKKEHKRNNSKQDRTEVDTHHAKQKVHFEDVGLQVLLETAEHVGAEDKKAHEIDRKVESEATAIGNEEDKAEETCPITVQIYRRPTSMAEVIKDLDDQFKTVCDSVQAVSMLLDPGIGHYSLSPNERAGKMMLKPAALFRSPSSRSSSSWRSTTTSSSSGYESSSDFSDDCSTSSSSHRSTLDKIYFWEKKLYKEVQSAQKMRTEYDKKLKLLRNQVSKRENPSVLEKTKARIRDPYAKLQVSMRSIRAFSKKILDLQDEELQPQLVKLVHGLSRMWKVMAECHETQKRKIDEANRLLAFMSSKLEENMKSSMSLSDAQRLAKLATHLQTELKNWRSCFQTWIASQQSYIHALTSWLLGSAKSDPYSSKSSSSPSQCSEMVPISGLLVQWSKFLGSIQERPVINALDFFVAGMGSIHAQYLKDDSVEAAEVEEAVYVGRMTEVAARVLCAGMSVAVGSLGEYAASSAAGYEELVKHCQNSNKDQ